MGEDARPSIPLPFWGEIKHVAGELWTLLLTWKTLLWDIAGASWFGAAVIVSMFLALYVIRFAVRSGNASTFAGALEHYAGLGLLVCGGYLAAWVVVWAILPLWTVLHTALWNSLTGGEPGLVQTLAFLASDTPARAAYLRDLAGLYASGDTALPLGWRAASFLTVAFGTMWLVSRGLGRLQGGRA
ncbi:hypothetical protein [Roseicella aquatilis]|uniref:Uncharacterized protein n=1 Tax=Roseicella aquatilis TaxID=2527868 RepID=A0A4R4D3X3_9PROT|nr:hypothetical protein [Roseicella aquatilis]TCZ51905.1 hypothetical protein EXY23_26560 [Roseicella aquatilis]